MKSKEQRKKECIEKLKIAQNNGDTEAAHSEADCALCEFINDPEIEAEYDKVDKWYA